SKAHLRPPLKKCHRSTATGCRSLSELHFQVAQKWFGLAWRSRIEHLLCQTSSACLNRRNIHSRGFYTIACKKNMGVIETAGDIARHYFDKHSLRRWHDYCTLTEGIHGKAC